MFHSRMLFGIASLFVLVIAIGCDGGSGGSKILKQENRISDCGGFGTEGRLILSDSRGYCDAEVLQWTYEIETKTLEITDARVLLNCCGVHDMTIVTHSGVYVITEIDNPMAGGGRCRCLCVYDFYVKAQGVEPGLISIRLMREVTDQPQGSGVVYEGQLDLSQGSGSIVIDESDVGMWCN